MFKRVNAAFWLGIVIRRRACAAIPALVTAAFLVAGGASQAQSPTDALPYSRGYLLTGNYAVGRIDLTEQSNPADQDGFSTGTIAMSGVPADADIVAAYLYWETITLTADLSQAAGVKFRGQEILLNDVMGVKKNTVPLAGSTAGCWSSGVPLSLTHFRADVLRLLPIRLDKDDQPTGKRLVNSADLTAHGQPAHTVTLPTRSGNQVPESAGASLVVVYRSAEEPLRKIVVYDGVHVQPSTNVSMTQTLQGFYRSSATKSAQVTHIVASGQPNQNERVFFNDSSDVLLAVNPFSGGSASQRWWGSPTYNVSLQMNPGNNSAGGFGETAMTRVDHASGGGYDCLTWGAVIFSTAVADVDGDGIPDGVEDSPAGVRDPPSGLFPAGEPLPNLNAMGASSAQKDLFVEFNAMRTMSAKSHGSPAAPYPGLVAPAFKKDVPPHTHMPTPEDLKRIGDLYQANGITPHFDVGDWADYKALGVVAHTDWVDDYTSDVADLYLVPSHLARGGEVMDERACDPASATCQFPDFPGTVSWKAGLQFYRDSPVGDGGEELLPGDDLDAWQAGAQRRRFDRIRRGLFHYVLYAHARGKPRSEFPCLVGAEPGPYDSNDGTSCAVDNPQFYVPSSASGVADLPGGSAMVTLGFWDEFVGRPFVRASTTFHEVGHNLNLWHGGQPAIWGNKALDTGTFVEPNCKPTYLSAMSYLFQVHGLFDDAGSLHLDFSGAQHEKVMETGVLSDAPLFPTAGYRPAWYAPAGSVMATNLGASAATRFCNGTLFDPAAPPVLMARVFADAASDAIDWNGDGVTNLADANQDVNFDQALSGSLPGFNDWTSLRLDQVSAGRNAVKFQDGDLMDFGSGDFVDFGSGDLLDFGSGDFVDFGSGDFVDFGSGAILDQASGDFVDFGSGDFVDFGSGDFVDFGSGDFLDFGSGSERQELDFETARALGRSDPHGLAACVVGTTADCAAILPPPMLSNHRIKVTWQAPSFGHVFRYAVSRKRGAANSTYPYLEVGNVLPRTFVDAELPNGIQFTYRVRAEFDDQTPHDFSGFSQPVTGTAVNDAPVAVADSYTTARNRTLNVQTLAAGVLANDLDADSQLTSLRAALVQGPSNGTLTLNANGSFTYVPRRGYTGPDSFTYRANNGVWSLDPSVPMSGDSNVATVSIAVTR